MQEKELINTQVKLEKFPGKGGWTYAPVPAMSPEEKNYFGWVKVKGFIEDYFFNQYHVMPMGKGRLFLPVKQEIRKKIKKEAGDLVKIRLWLDEDPRPVPADLLECLNDEPKALESYQSLSEQDKKSWLDYISNVKTTSKRIERIATAINQLASSRKDAKLVPGGK